jgi:hypothetical protein
MLRRLFASDPPAVQQADVPSADMSIDTMIDAAEADLRNALDAVAPAERRLEQARAAVARVLTVIDAEEPAQAAAEAAAQAASLATKRWAESGADAALPPGDAQLLDAATDAQRRAAQARLQASGAKAGLAAIREIEADAVLDLERARDEVLKARSGVLLAMVERDLRVLMDGNAERQAARTRILALRDLMDGRHGRAHPWYAFTDGVRSDFIAQRLVELSSPAVPTVQLHAEIEEWLATGKRLLNDDASK